MNGSAGAQIKEKFAEIYNDTYAYIYKYVISKVSGRETAEDIVQNVYLKFYKRMCDEGSAKILNPKHYLLRSARGLVADYYAENSKAETESIDEGIEIIDEKALDLLMNDSSYEYEDIMRMLKEMDAVTYKIFILHFQYGYTIIQVADKMSLKQSTVKSKIYRALKRLKKEITDKEGEDYAYFRRS